MKKPTWLLLGGETLAGKEIRELVEERKLPVRLLLASASAEDRVLTTAEEDFLVMQPLDAELLAEAEVVFLAATPEMNREALALAKKKKLRPVWVDMMAEFEDLPESVLRAPVMESQAPLTDAQTIHTLAHPAALALARLVTLLDAKHAVRSVVATVFEPASERGRAGVDELHQQTVTLFNFQARKRAVYDTQVSFTVLPRYGAEAPVSLASVEQRVERHLASLLGASRVPLPSVRVVHAPVFHGYCQNVWLEFASRPAVAEVEGLLREAGLEVAGEEEEPGSNVSAAGQSGVMVSDVSEDRGSARGLWVWLVCDNLRLRAENALLTAGLAARKENA